MRVDSFCKELGTLSLHLKSLFRTCIADSARVDLCFVYLFVGRLARFKSRRRRFVRTFRRAGNIVHRGDLQTNPHEFADTIYDASGKQTLTHSKTKGRWGSLLNMITETKSEQFTDGDGRPVVEKKGFRGYHVNNPPGTTLTTSPYLFQVWSTVLGASLTSVLPDGTKFETGIYAGGTRIAGLLGSGSIAWKTADPVTGSSVQMNSDGTEQAVLENEPLGQNIYLYDPEVIEPPANDTNVFTADDAHWKCEQSNAAFLYGDMTRSPFECQKRYLQDLDIPLKDFFGWGGKKESSARVSILIRKSLPPSPHGLPDGGSTYAANSMRSAALKSTAKDDYDTNCLPGRPCLPKEEVSFKIPLIDMSEIPGFVDARQSGNNDSERRLTKREVYKIAKDIQAIFDANPDCLPFIAGILEKAQSDGKPLVSTNPLDALWATYRQDGIHVRNLGNRAWGAVAKGTSEIYLVSRPFSFVPAPDVRISKTSIQNMTRTQELLRAQDALAEAIHNSGAFSYNDRDMSIALAKHTGQEVPKFPFKLAGDEWAWSGWWHPHYALTGSDLQFSVYADV